MKTTLLLLLLVSLAACGGGAGSISPLAGGSSGTGSQTQIQTIDIVTTGITTDISYSEPVNLSISGIANTVNIDSDIANLTLEGMNNILIFGDGVSVDQCVVPGSDNTLQKPAAMNLSCNFIGPGNNII